MALIEFLNTSTPKADLSAALRVLREFKDLESQQEWLMVPFEAWTKLEQLEEFLAHLVEGAPLDDDTIRALAAKSAPGNTGEELK